MNRAWPQTLSTAATIVRALLLGRPIPPLPGVPLPHLAAAAAGAGGPPRVTGALLREGMLSQVGGSLTTI